MMVPRLNDPTSTPRRLADEPTYAEIHARLLLAQSVVAHRLDTENPDVAAVLAILRGDLSLAGVE